MIARATRRSSIAVILLVGACTPATTSEGIDPSTLPVNLRNDYAVFADRCSKCHSLARPLESGITSDEYWAIYVDKMRHMQSSGIGPEDEAPILRFLHWYSVEGGGKKKGAKP